MFLIHYVQFLCGQIFIQLFFHMLICIGLTSPTYLIYLLGLQESLVLFHEKYLSGWIFLRQLLCENHQL